MHRSLSFKTFLTDDDPLDWRRALCIQSSDHQTGQAETEVFPMTL